jgi:hypothetical protein
MTAAIEHRDLVPRPKPHHAREVTRFVGWNRRLAEGQVEVRHVKTRKHLSRIIVQSRYTRENRQLTIVNRQIAKSAIGNRQSAIL